MLTASRGCGHHLDEDIVSGHPDLEEGVDVDGGAPLDNLEDLGVAIPVGLFFSRLESLGGAIDGHGSGFRDFKQVTSEVGLHGELVADLLGEDGVGGVGATVTGGQGPAGSGVVGVGDVVVGLDGADSGNARIWTLK